MTNKTEERNPLQDHFDNIVTEEIKMGVNQGRLTYSYSNRVVTALDQELREWQARSVHLERQLRIVRQDNFNLRCQLEEWNKGTINHCTIGKTPSPQVEKGESSRKQSNEQGQGGAATKKARIIRCCHCGKLNHRKSEIGREPESV